MTSFDAERGRLVDLIAAGATEDRERVVSWKSFRRLEKSLILSLSAGVILTSWLDDYSEYVSMVLELPLYHILGVLSCMYNINIIRIYPTIGRWYSSSSWYAPSNLDASGVPELSLRSK